jgi:hypothetical protein
MLRIENPYKTGEFSGGLLLVSGADLERLQSLNTQAQIYSNGKYSPLTPLQVMLKFLYDVVDVNPPQPWSDPNG